MHVRLASMWRVLLVLGIGLIVFATFIGLLAGEVSAQLLTNTRDGTVRYVVHVTESEPALSFSALRVESSVLSGIACGLLIEPNGSVTPTSTSVGPDTLSMLTFVIANPSTYVVRCEDRYTVEIRENGTDSLLSSTVESLAGMAGAGDCILATGEWLHVRLPIPEAIAVRDLVVEASFVCNDTDVCWWQSLTPDDVIHVSTFKLPPDE